MGFYVRSAVVGRLDIAPPRAGFTASALDELLEATEITLGPTADEAELVADLLGDAFRVELELEHDAGLVVVHAVERDGAGVGGAVRRVPGDPLVGMLLGDLRVPLTPDAANVAVARRAVATGSCSGSAVSSSATRWRTAAGPALPPGPG